MVKVYNYLREMIQILICEDDLKDRKIIEYLFRILKQIKSTLKLIY